jgi:hypothetical protein
MPSAPVLTTKHPAHPPPTPNFMPDGLQTMQELADLTGGRAYYNKNDLSGALRIALDDSVVTYTLGFYPDSDAFDGKFHDLKVEVTRPGLNVRYRKGYVASKDLPASDDDGKRSLRKASESPIESSAIPLAAKIERRNGALAITVSVDIHNLQLSRENAFSNGAVNIFFVQQTETGKVLNSTEAPIELHLTKEQYEGFLRNGMTIKQLVALKEGVKTLRVLSVDRGNAAVGSLIIPLSQVQ